MNWNFDEEINREETVCVKYDLRYEIFGKKKVIPMWVADIALLSEEIADITVTCVAPGKTFNLAGMSTSSVIISNPVLRKYFNRKVEILHSGNGNIFGPVASTAAYNEGAEWLDALKGYINGNINFVIDYCRQLIPEIIPVQP